MIRILFIIPYQEMVADIEKALEAQPYREQIEYRCEFHRTYEDLVGYSPDWQCDIVIARGYSADALMENKLPCIIQRITFNSVDIINTLHECRSRYRCRKIGIIGHPSLTLAAETIKLISDIPFEIYTDHGLHTDYEAIVRTALQNDCDMIVGGGAACTAAERLGVRSFDVKTNSETIYSVIENAIRIYHTNQQERGHLQTLQTILNHSPECYILVNADGTVALCNPSAASLLSKNVAGIIGREITELLPATAEYVQKAVRTRQPSGDEVFRHDGNTYTARILPILGENSIEYLLLDLRDVHSIQKMEAHIRNKLYEKGMTTHYTFQNIVCGSKVMTGLIEQAKQFAEVDSNIILEGQTGTGKELFAQSIHSQSKRSNRPFVAVNCSTIPENLLESELFGYVGGAFTGALKEGKKGLFELAHGGTLFLDEISDLPYPFQARLLRVLQEHEIRKIGDDRVIPVDVRIIAASNQNILNLVYEHKFRKDLYFRLSILRIQIPSLNERPEDIFLIFRSFIEQYAARFGKTAPVFTDNTQRLLQAHTWVGNVRELRNTAERFMVLYTPGTDPDHLLQSCLDAATEGLTPVVSQSLTDEEREMERLKEALHNTRTLQQAAGLLGMSRTTLWRKLKQYGIET